MGRFTFRFPGRSGPTGDGPPDGSPGRPIARRTSPARATGCGVAFFGGFLLAGLGAAAFFAVPVVRVVEARSWQAAECVILESRVATHTGDDGATYSVEVLFRYTAGGRDYRSDRYDFFPGSSGGRSGKERIVAELAPGTRTACWFDPEEPREAVLERGLTLEFLWALFPVPFVVVGAGGIAMVLLRSRRRATEAARGRPAWMPEVAGSPVEAAGSGDELALSAPAASDAPLELEPRFSPLGKLLGVIAMALVWNGLVGVFVYFVWQDWQAGNPDGCLTFFLVPFVLVGALFLVGVPYQLLSLFNPRPRLVLTPGRLTLGSTAELRWRFVGRAGRIRRLRIFLEGEEEADYTRGTDHYTDRETFARLELLDTDSPVALFAGVVPVRVPADTMHSFQAPDNRIVWTLRLRGSIRFWPDVTEDFPLVVAPLPVPGGPGEEPSWPLEEVWS